MTTQPNIIFMIADDHRHNAINSLGDSTVQTPNLDSLVNNGTAFRRAHIMGGLTGAVCVPTRACMMTGAHTFQATHSRDMRGPLRVINPDLALMPETFRQAGYHTFATGKWHNDKASFARCFADGGNIFFGGMSDHDKVPVQPFDPSGIYPEDAITLGEKQSSQLFAETANDFLEGYDRADPFFLYIAFTAPHDPRTAPAEYHAQYNPADMPLPPNFAPEHPFDNGELRVRDEELAPFPRTPEIVQQHIADYYAIITYLDAQIGRVLAALQANSLAENTLIVYTADHGLAVGQHGLLGKQNLYDHSIRVPSIISGPGVPSSRKVDALTFSYDMFPTLCDLTGLSIPETIASRSLVPLMQNQAGQVRESVFSLYQDVQRSVTQGDWKLIRTYHSTESRAGEDRVQLFNIAADPWEQVDLTADPEHQPRLQQLAAELADWQQQVEDPWANRPVLPEH